MKQFVELPKLKPGDRVALVSPAGDAAARFPWVYKFGVERIEKEFGLSPKEYPFTRKLAATHQEKASELMEAFADPKNKAVISTLGGYDQVRLLKHLDAKVFTDNPKPFFGYSDNAHLVNYLWNLGIPSYYGGGVMIQFGHSYVNSALTDKYLKHALFDKGEFELSASKEFNDEAISWEDQKNWRNPPKAEKSDGWLWDGDKDAEGILWGGCLEAYIATFAAGQPVPSNQDIEGCILFLETSEEMPEPWMVAHFLNGLGERGWFDRLQGVLFGRPKAWNFHRMLSLEEKVKFRQAQQKAVIDSIRFYNRHIPVIQNMEFGHTDPQIVVPAGQKGRIDSKQKKIFFNY